MGKENPKPRKLPDGSVDVKSYLTPDGRDDINLGVNHDGTDSPLPGYIEIDGVRYHPERVPKHLQPKKE